MKYYRRKKSLGEYIHDQKVCLFNLTEGGVYDCK